MGKVIYHKLTVTTKKEDERLVHSVESTGEIDNGVISAQKRANEVAYTAAENQARDKGQIIGDFVSRLEYLTGASD